MGEKNMEEVLIEYIAKIINHISESQSYILKNQQEEYKITPNEFRIIEIIGSSSEPKMMKDIAQLMSMTKGGMTFLADKLEKKGLVRRKQNEMDRRILYIELTEKGQKMFEDYNRYKYNILFNWIENMSPSTKKLMEKEFNKALDLAK
jgi:DNA-binding MarR family transcriptional regulator